MKNNLLQYKKKFISLRIMEKNYKLCPTRAAREDIAYYHNVLDELFSKLGYKEKEELATWTASQDAEWIDDE